MKNNISCWVMTTGEAGMRSQVIGLAERLTNSFTEKTISLNSPWRWLPGHMAPFVLSPLAHGGDDLSPPWPDLLITCGRRSVALSIAIKKASKGKTFTVHIQDPRVPTTYFDVVTCPLHDRISGPNVYSTMGALHKVTSEKLSEAKKQFSQMFSSLPHPLVAVLIGGNSKSYSLTDAIAEKIAVQVQQLDQRGYGIVLSYSSRTPQNAKSIINKQLAGTNVFIWDGNGANPYLGMLALADYIIVTSDSASMVSEAAATGKPVMTIALEGGSKKFDAFHAMMCEQGYISSFDGELSNLGKTILDETGRVAMLISENMEKYQSSHQPVRPA